MLQYAQLYYHKAGIYRPENGEYKTDSNLIPCQIWTMCTMETHGAHNKGWYKNTCIYIIGYRYALNIENTLPWSIGETL